MLFNRKVLIGCLAMLVAMAAFADVTVKVEPINKKQSSGVYVNAGDTIKVEAAGQWTLWDQYKQVDANGHKDFVVNDLGAWGALIGRIGNHEFLIGTSAEFTSEVAGVLYLYPNKKQGIVAELQAKVYVNSVTPTADGKGIVLAFSDGKTYTVSNGTDGNTPVIGVKKDTDGNYYWTLNGEWLTDGSGNKIRTTGDQGEPGEAGITPQVKIQDKKWYVSVDGGTTWTEAGDATVVGDSLFKNVKLDDEGKNVIFTFQDDSTITIPVVPVVKKLQLLFDETMIQSIMSGATATVDYTISGPDDETVEFDTFENNGYKVVVTPTNETSGTIAVTAPDPAVKGKVLFILTGSKGSSFVKTVTINANPSLKPEKTEYSVDAKAGEITINVAANVAYTSEIVATKLSAIDIPDSPRFSARALSFAAFGSSSA